MTREIKFRVWDKKFKNWTISMLQYNPDGSLTAEPNGILMQYTGLKDKNGKEIYEGDICPSKISGESQVIIFSKCGFTVGDKNSEYPASLQYLPVFHNQMEVIGNIYENPELLEKDNAH
jgi:uncharacterized phage protein (TIGR01671 family)